MNDTWITTKICDHTQNTTVHGIAADNNETIYFTTHDEHIYTIIENNDNNNNNNITPQILVTIAGAELCGIVWTDKNYLHVCDEKNHRILSYSTIDKKITTLAGNAKANSSKDGTIKSAHLWKPRGITVDRIGNLYTTEWPCIRKINVNEGTVVTVAGSFGSGFKDGAVKQANFQNPVGIAVGDDDTIYVADYDCIRKIKDGNVSTIAGKQQDAKLKNPRGLVVYDGKIIVGDENGLRILDQPTQQEIPRVYSLSTDIQCNIYVGTASNDKGNSSIWKVVPVGESAIKSRLNYVTTWKHLRLFLVGDSGVGKTSVVRWLKGEKFNPDHISTDSVEVRTALASSWKDYNFEPASYVADIIHHAPKPAKKPTHKSATQSKGFFNLIPELFASTQQEPEDEPKPTQASKAAEKLPVEPELLQSIAQKIKEDPMQMAFHIWDFAGQEEYYNTHHLFVSEDAIYLLVVDISKQIIDIHRIKFWLNSIKFYAESAPIILVGTHKDGVGEEAATKALQYILSEVGHHNFAKWITVSCKDDAPEPTRELLAEVAKTKMTLKQCKLNWMLFYDAITKKQDEIIDKNQNNNQHIISVASVRLPDARQIAHSFHMNDNDVTEALQFFHQNGFIFHFDDDILRNTIFTKPEELVTVLKTVVTSSELCKSKLSAQEFQLLESQGRISQQLLSQLWANYPKPLHKKFRALLQKFDLAFYDPTQQNRQHPDLIVPSLVKTSPEFHTDGSQIQVICKMDSVPPLGFANRLMSRILTMTDVGGVSWCKLFRGGCQFAHGNITFIITTSPETVLIEAIYRSTTVQELTNMLSEILEKIYLTAKAHKKNFKISTTTKCILCGKHDKVVDAQREDFELTKFTYAHFCCTDCFGHEPAEKVLLRILHQKQTAQHIAKVSEQNLRDIPQILDLMHALRPHLEKVAFSVSWQKLAEELGYNADEIKIFESIDSTTATSPVVEFLKDWILRPASTVGHLLQVLENMKNQAAIDTIHRVLTSSNAGA